MWAYTDPFTDRVNKRKFVRQEICNKHVIPNRKHPNQLPLSQTITAVWRILYSWYIWLTLLLLHFCYLAWIWTSLQATITVQLHGNGHGVPSYRYPISCPVPYAYIDRLYEVHVILHIGFHFFFHFKGKWGVFWWSFNFYYGILARRKCMFSGSLSPPVSLPPPPPSLATALYRRSLEGDRRQTTSGRETDRVPTCRLDG